MTDYEMILGFVTVAGIYGGYSVMYSTCVEALKETLKDLYGIESESLEERLIGKIKENGEQ